MLHSDGCKLYGCNERKVDGQKAWKCLYILRSGDLYQKFTWNSCNEFVEKFYGETRTRIQLLLSECGREIGVFGLNNKV